MNANGIRRAAAAFVIALSALASAAADPPAKDAPGLGRPRRTLGFSIAAEGYGEGTGQEPGELAAFGLVLDPFRWSILVPSASAIVSVPVFPWAPERALLEARLDLRFFALRSRALGRLTREPTLYAPAVSFSWILPADGRAPLAALGLKPFAARMGDGIYSILSPALVVDPRGGLGILGYSIELFEFTHFLR